MEIYMPTWSRGSGLKDKLLSQQLRGFGHKNRRTHNSKKFRANSIDSTKEEKSGLEENNRTEMICCAIQWEPENVGLLMLSNAENKNFTRKLSLYPI